MEGEAHDDAGSLTRRRFLQAGAAAAVLAGGYGGSHLSRHGSGPSGAVARFHSRPDLTPPAVHVERAPGAAVAPGHVFLTPKLGPGQLGPLVVDGSGSPVWFQPRPDVVVSDFRVQRYEETPVLTWWEGHSQGGYGSGVGVIADSSYTEVGRVSAGGGYGADLHEFLITPEGTALVCAYSPVDGVLEAVVQEISIDTGQVLFEWHSRDHVAVDESYAARPDQASTPYDYFHVNSVDVDEDGNLLISGRNTHAVYKVERHRGDVLWRLGGRKSDFTFGEGAGFGWQHDARHGSGGRLTIFDNEDSPKLADQSRAIVLRLDTDRMTASLEHAYVHPRGLLSQSQGNVQVLDGGNVFVGWGYLPWFSEFSADGRLLFDARFAGGGQSYRAYKFGWTGQPNEPPATVIEFGPGGRATVYASWNGATELASWQVMGGPTPDALAPLASSPRLGFETAIRLPTVPAYVSVSALDASGAVLRASAQVDLSARNTSGSGG